MSNRWMDPADDPRPQGNPQGEKATLREYLDYYQGLAGVRKYGMYDDTKRYVANVLYLKRRFEQGNYPA